MTERLDRIELLLTALADRQDRFQQQMEESDRRLRESISDSDRRLRESDRRLRESVSDSDRRLRESDRRLRESINDVVSMIGTLAEQQAELREQQAETDQRFENLLNDARADRQQQERNRVLNENEHLAFRETVQTLLAEIARIWQRLAG